MDDLVVKMSSRQILHPHGFNASQIKRVFIAYRMGVPASEHMRESLSGLLRARGFEVIDGQVLKGQYWAPEIRKRLKSANLIVADVTGPSREVIFELGAVGPKPEFPIVEAQRDLDSAISWLGSYELATYGGTHITSVASRAEQMLVTRKPVNSVRPPPWPGMVVWLESKEYRWSGPMKDQVRERCLKAGLEFIDASLRTHTAPEDVRELLRSSLVIAVMSGGPEDVLAHYLIGDVVSRPTASKGALARFAITVSQDDAAERLLVASSVRQLPSRFCRCVTRSTEVVELVARRIEGYRRFIGSTLEED